MSERSQKISRTQLSNDEMSQVVGGAGPNRVARACYDCGWFQHWDNECGKKRNVIENPYETSCDSFRPDLP